MKQKFRSSGTEVSSEWNKSFIRMELKFHSDEINISFR